MSIDCHFPGALKKFLSEFFYNTVFRTFLLKKGFFRIALLQINHLKPLKILAYLDVGRGGTGLWQ